MEELSEASCCEEREAWEEWDTQSSVSLSQEREPHESGSEAGACACGGGARETARLRRRLAAERARRAAAERAHHARLAELHGVIAELVRRRQPAGIPEEVSERGSLTEGGESSTQPAGELDHTQDDTHSCEAASSAYSERSPPPPPPPPAPDAAWDASKTLDRDEALDSGQGVDSDSRKEDDLDRCTGESDARPRLRTATRVKLRRTADPRDCRDVLGKQSWCLELAERLTEETRAGGAWGEALATACSDASHAALAAAEARAERLAADARVLEETLGEAKDQAERLWTTCAQHEAWSVCLCAALRAADRALETYDVLLALAESETHADRTQRSDAELVAGQLLSRLDEEAAGAGATDVSSPLLPPGPWLRAAPPAPATPAGPAAWGAEHEARLRAHAARLKSETASVRVERPPAPLHAFCSPAECVPGGGGGGAGALDALESALLVAEAAAAREERAALRAALAAERARAAALERALQCGELARVHASGRRRPSAAETKL